MKKFCTVQKNHREKIERPPSPLIRKIFQYPKILETPKSSQTKNFGNLRQQIFDGES